MEKTLILSDCLAALKEIPDNSIDAIVTDPPYGLSFMGKKWDYDVPSVEIWQECLRVLKPSGHLLAFAGTRTQHRMAVRIEDAGFEIRDMIAWVYSTGFPKSHNFGCKCSRGALPYSHEENLSREPKAERDLHPLWNSNVSPSLGISEGRGEVLQPCMSQSGASIEGREQLSSAEVWSGESSMEGWGNILEKEGQLQVSQVCPLPEGVFSNGEEGRICDGTPFNNGEDVRTLFIEDRSSASCEPQPAGQPAGESRVISKQRSAQERGVEANQVCEKCGKLAQWQGWGTALKPALEPITVARKPLIGTVAENVLEHGTGALNVDGCRVGTSEVLQGSTVRNDIRGGAFASGHKPNQGDIPPFQQNQAGRWPANLIHDGSEEVVGLFPQTSPSKSAPRNNSEFKSVAKGKDLPHVTYGHDDNGGSAARFFYCAKASKRDRDEGLEEFEARPAAAMAGNMVDGQRLSGDGKPIATPTRANNHPTVKPTDLMRYLCRLVTPPSGTVLDPFMGSGSTGKAAMLEGFQFVGIERDHDYFKIAEARINSALEKSEGELWARSK